MKHKDQAEVSYKLSLRLWSDTVPLRPVISVIGYPVQHIHVKGRPIEVPAGKPTRIAPHHYASIASAQVQTEHEVSDWLFRVAGRLSQLDSVALDGLEIVFWIAIFGRVRAENPEIARYIVDLISSLGANIFVENYTALNETIDES